MRGVRAVYGTGPRFKCGAAGVVLGLILLAAAGLKAHQLATEPTAEAGLMTSRWFLVAAVELEILLGLCLLSGVLARTVWLAAGLPIGWLAARFEPAIVTDEGEILGESQIVVLEPERWVGSRFPLLPHIDIGSRLAEGRWMVLLYHDDCPECRRVLPEYERVARLARDAGRPRVALVEVPPFRSEDDRGAIAGVQRGRLSDAKDWFVQTPTEIRLDRGIVTAIRGAESFTRDRRESRAQQEVQRLDGRKVRVCCVVIR